MLTEEMPIRLGKKIKDNLEILNSSFAVTV